MTSPALRSAEGLARIWTEPRATQQYYPLLHSAFWLEHRLWGGAPHGYHAANIALHALAACLLARLLSRLAVPGAFCAAAVFALHPVQVESVAWISEQKNTLSAVFYFGAALAYLGFDAQRTIARYVVALGLFACALLSKTVTATLPAALLVILWWQRGRLEFRRDVAPLLPWLGLGIAAGLMTAWIERAWIGAEGAAFDLTPIERLLLAGRIVVFYARKLFWPANLSFIYPRWQMSAAELTQWLPLLAVTAITIAVWRLRHRTRAPLAAWLLFVGTLFPALGFFNVYPFRYAFVADHFQYLAGTAIITLAVGTAARCTPPAGWSVRIAAGGAVIAFLALVRAQSLDYRDAETLYRRTIVRNPAAWMAHNNLGELLLKDPPRRAEAFACFERALALQPDYFEAHNNLGLGLAQTGRTREALPHLEEAIRLKPGSPEAHNNLAIARASAGQMEAAIEAFALAARLNPTVPNIRENWAKALRHVGRTAEAEAQFAEATRLRAAARQ